MCQLHSRHCHQQNTKTEAEFHTNSSREGEPSQLNTLRATKKYLLAHWVDERLHTILRVFIHTGETPCSGFCNIVSFVFAHTWCFSAQYSFGWSHHQGVRPTMGKFFCSTREKCLSLLESGKHFSEGIVNWKRSKLSQKEDRVSLKSREKPFSSWCFIFIF